MSDTETTDGGLTQIPGRAFFFVLADEVLPSGKVVRKVIAMPVKPEDFVLANPERFGIKPPNPQAGLSVAEHVMGSNQSRYLSASSKPGGAPNIGGRPVWIDVAKVRQNGGIIHSTEDIIADLNRVLRDNPSNPGLAARIEKLKHAIQHVEGEVLIEGNVPAGAVKSRGAMMATRGLRFVQIIGVGMTIYDVGKATYESVEEGSPAPIAAEAIRQVGGWGGAWLGMKAGFAGGALLGIETGPGAIVTGGIGALVLGAAGYFGADWVADLIHEN